MIPKLEQVLKELKKVLSEETDEKRLKAFLDATLPDLDRLIRESGVRPADNVITTIRTAQSCQVEIIQFMNLCEEIDDVHTKEDAQDLMQQLDKIKVVLQNLAVCARVDKEYRGLLEALPELPSSGTDSSGMLLNQKKNSLNQRAPTCPACGERTQVITSQTNAWWQCSTFPHCYEKQWMSKRDKEYLGFS